MKVGKWLKKTGHTKQWLAKQIGITNYRLSRLLSGQSEILVTEVAKVYDVTGGEVDFWDWTKKKNTRKG